MGAIPLLNRDKERSVARDLEDKRDRFRLAAFRCTPILMCAAFMFDRVQAGQYPIDPAVDTNSSAKLERGQILGRLPHHLPVIHHLLDDEKRHFAEGLESEDPKVLAAWRRRAGTGSGRPAG